MMKPSMRGRYLSDPDNPCVRNCCLDQDDVCLGCFRTLEEITGWRKLSEEDRIAALERCEVRRQAHQQRQQRRRNQNGS